MESETAGTQPSVKLRIWSGDWDLASVDMDCLSVITYAKFMEAPLTLEETIPSKTVTGTLPELQIEESVFTSPLNILGIFRREGYNSDFNLSSIEHADTLAYIALVEEKLKPGLLQNLWLDSVNFVNATRKAYAKSFGFFRSYWNLPQLRKKIEQDLFCRGNGSSSEREIYFNREAKNCITLLSQRLGNKDYFFGSSPTSFDAVAFGHLSVILKAPLVTMELKNHLLACDNLCKYCSRISHRYFKDCPSVAGEQKSKKEKDERSQQELKDRRNIVIAIGAAIFVNIAFLLAKGIIVPKSSGNKSDLIETEDIVD